MDINIERLENNEVKANVKADETTVRTEYGRACHRLSKVVNIPGFRKGKVPPAILERHLGKDYINNEILEAVLPGVISETAQKNNLDIIAKPVLEKYSFNDDGSLDFTLKFELRPEVNLGNYKSEEYEVKNIEYGAEEEEKELENLRERFSTFDSVEGRPAGDKDIVIIDFEGFIGKEPIKGGAAKDYQLDLGNSNFIAGFAEQIVGKNKGEEFTINVKFPDNYHDDAIKGKDAEFKINLKDIKQRVLPEVNDEFAKKVGGGDNVESLKADVRKYLDQRAEREKKSAATEVIFEKLLKNTDINIHEAMINREIAVLRESFVREAQNRGQSYEEAVKIYEAENANFEKELREEAVRRIKTSLIVSQIAKDEKIDINSEDIQNKIGNLAGIYGLSPADVAKEASNNFEILNALSQQVISEKTIEFLLNNLKIKYV